MLKKLMTNIAHNPAADGQGATNSGFPAGSPVTPGQHSTGAGQASSVVNGTGINAGNPVASGGGGGSASGPEKASSGPFNLPAVLKDRVPHGLRPGPGSRGPPPPVPPRSPKRVNINAPSPRGVPTNAAKGEIGMQLIARMVVR